MRSIDPDLLRSFIAIIDTGSYGAAADLVHKTQSTVSAQIKRLEEILDVQLFDKVGRRNAVTPAGRRLLEYARSMVRLNDETLGVFRPAPVAGRIAIGTSDDYAEAFFPPILGRFARSHPAIEVEVATGAGSDMLDRLDDGTFDAVITSIESGGGDIERLRTDRLHWIGADRCRLHERNPLPLALWSEGCAWRSMALAELSRSGRAWRVVHTTSNAPLLTSVVREGLGVTVAPRWYLSPGLQIVEELDAAHPLGTTDIGIKVRPGADSPALDAFLTYLRASLQADTSLAA